MMVMIGDWGELRSGKGIGTTSKPGSKKWRLGDRQTDTGRERDSERIELRLKLFLRFIVNCEEKVEGSVVRALRYDSVFVLHLTFRPRWRNFLTPRTVHSSDPASGICRNSMTTRLDCVETKRCERGAGGRGKSDQGLRNSHNTVYMVLNAV